MRTIKFRAWDCQENKMNTIGCLGAGSSCQFINIGFDGSLTLCNAYGLMDGTNPAFDSPVTERFKLMQFTGLLDKNGKEIYEGDVVNMNKGNMKCENRFVKWDSLTYSWHFSTNGVTIAFEKFMGRGYGFEIIGNIHENPELINH